MAARADTTHGGIFLLGCKDRNLDAVVPMPLNKKIHLVLIAVLASYVVLSYGVFTAILIPAFEDLELDQAKMNLHRVEYAIQNELEDLVSQGADWADWDESHRFVQKDNPSFRDNLSADILKRIDIDLMLFFDIEHHLAGGWYAGIPAGQAPVRTALFAEPLQPQDHLFSPGLSGKGIPGLLSTKLGWMLVSSQPIVTADHRGPAAGILMVGRLLDTDRIGQIRLRTGVDFQLLELGNETLIDGLETASLPSTQPVFMNSPDEERLLGYKLLSDIYRAPALLLEVHTLRDSTALGSKTVYLGLLLLILAGVVVIGATRIVLQHSIIGPLSELKAHFLEIRKSRELGKRIDMQRGDEIGVLAEEFDALTAELAVARKNSLEQTFKAGMAETAAGVLHNIRNAMTPLVNRINRASSAIQEADRLHLTDALVEIQDRDCEPERVVKLAQYLKLAHGELHRAHQTAYSDLEVACKQVVQVEAILAEQECLAHSQPVMEVLELGDVVREAANVLPDGDGERGLIRVDDSVAGHRVKAHRLGLVQVLCNVLVNAREAIERTGREDGFISFEAARESHQAGDMIELLVKDNGIGIESDRLTKIFQRGHTSKTSGTGGLGLHWCANTLGGMGGWLRVDSAGAGMGAEFLVYLPEA